MIEVTNDLRAEWADEAVYAFAAVTHAADEEELDTLVGDLLCDLMHLCDRDGLDFAALLERAQTHYAAEVADEEGLESGD